jgi:hypothetical protein
LTRTLKLSEFRIFCGINENNYCEKLDYKQIKVSFEYLKSPLFLAIFFNALSVKRKKSSILDIKMLYLSSSKFYVDRASGKEVSTQKFIMD